MIFTLGLLRLTEGFTSTMDVSRKEDAVTLHDHSLDLHYLDPPVLDSMCCSSPCEYTDLRSLETNCLPDEDVPKENRRCSAVTKSRNYEKVLYLDTPEALNQTTGGWAKGYEEASKWICIYTPAVQKAVEVEKKRRYAEYIASVKEQNRYLAKEEMIKPDKLQPAPPIMDPCEKDNLQLSKALWFYHLEGSPSVHQADKKWVEFQIRLGCIERRGKK